MIRLRSSARTRRGLRSIAAWSRQAQKLVRAAGLGASVGDIPVEDADDAVAVLERQRRVHHVVEELHDRRRRRRWRPQREDGDDGESRILHEHPHAKLEIHRPAREPAESARVALVFLRLLDTAERAPCGVARLVALMPRATNWSSSSRRCASISRARSASARPDRKSDRSRSKDRPQVLNMMTVALYLSSK